jgi:UDP-glucose 4-epimerase
MKVLVTGGAGFIGSTVALALLDVGAQPIVLDDLSRGPAAFLRQFPGYVGDVADPAVLDRIFADHPDIDAAVHCAARTVVTESLADPAMYYRANVGKTIDFVTQLIAHGCHRLIFSSSASVYGTTHEQLITEATPVRPQSPYASSKVIVERMLDDICAATALTAVSLRYFNPIGSDPRHRTGPYDPGPMDVMGALLSASATGDPFWIHGRDWPTPDGTPIRDFVHVWDVALAHLAALRAWPALTERAEHQVLNIGSGHGTTVRQLVEAFNDVASRPVELRYDGRREGDIAGGYPDIRAARSLLDWQPTRTVTDGVRDALAWADALRSGAALQ